MFRFLCGTQMIVIQLGIEKAVQVGSTKGRQTSFIGILQSSKLIGQEHSNVIERVKIIFCKYDLDSRTY